MSDIIQGRNIQSEIAYRETAGDLNRQQAANLRAQEPHIAAKMLADIDQSREAAGASRSQRITNETLLPLKVEQERAQTTEIEARTRRVNELLNYEKRNIDANIQQSLASAGASNASAARARLLAPKEAALLDKQNAEYVQMQINGQQFTAKGMDLAKERNDNIQKIIELEKARAAKISAARKDARAELKMSTDAETVIKTLYSTSHKDLKPEEISPQLDMYHATSKNPLIYVLEPDPSKWEKFRGTGDDTAYRKIRPITLPKVDGHQYTAQEVYDAAASKSMTVQQYMEQVFYPSLRQPVPWTVPKAPQ